MLISLEEYNRVIDGLRQQLILQRRLIQEKINDIETLRELRKGDHERIVELTAQNLKLAMTLPKKKKSNG